MMNREEILQTLKDHNSELKKLDVDSLAIFGSMARGTARKTSDVDILVEFSRPIGLFEFARLKLYQEMRETILREATQI